MSLILIAKKLDVGYKSYEENNRISYMLNNKFDLSTNWDMVSELFSSGVVWNSLELYSSYDSNVVGYPINNNYF